MVHPENGFNSQVAIAIGDDVSLRTGSVTKPKPKPVEKPTPKPEVKPTVISESDLVGQILLQGFGSSGSKSQTGTQAKPTSMQKPNTTGKAVSDLATRLKKIPKTTGTSKSNVIQEPKPPQPAVKPSVVSETDLVGQILLQGCGSNRSPAPSQWPLISGNTASSNTQLPAAIARTSIQKPSGGKATIKDSNKATAFSDLKATSKPRTASTHVSWDMNKVLAPRLAEKRPRDVLDEQAQDEMNAKRQRLAQWLGSCVSIIL